MCSCGRQRRGWGLRQRLLPCRGGGGGRREETHLQRGPAPGAVAALQAAEELGVPGLVGVHVEAQVLVGQEAGAADPAQVRPHQRLGGLVAVPAGRRRRGVSPAGGPARGLLPEPPRLSPSPHVLAVFLAQEPMGGPASSAGKCLGLAVGGRVPVLRTRLAHRHFREATGARGDGAGHLGALRVTQ